MVIGDILAIESNGSKINVDDLDPRKIIPNLSQWNKQKKLRLVVGVKPYK